MHLFHVGTARALSLWRVALFLSILSCARLPADTLVLSGSTWTYDDSGTDLGTAWKEAGYDDGGWDSGPAQLGYGDGDEATTISYGPDSSNKYITYYFRQAFVAADPPPYASLKLRVVRDDGCVVYINGEEVARSNMPSGTITYSTLASAAVGDTDESAWNEFPVDPEVLSGTTNVIAVEIHQHSGTSSDVSFDLELEGLPPIPAVTLQSPPDQSTVNSTSVSFQCLAADSLGLSDATLYLGSQPETLVLSGPLSSVDTVIREDAPSTNYGSEATTKVDGLTPHAHSLVKFPDLVGDGPGQVRPFAVVVSATLQVKCTNASPDLIQIYRLIQDWTEDGATWNDRMAGTPWSTPGADGPYSRTMTAYEGDCSATGIRTFNVTGIVQEWVNLAQNFGFLLTDSGDDGVDFDTSESGNPPVLTVEYQPDWNPVETQYISGTSATVTFNRELTDGQGYTWNCLVTNTSGQQSWAPADFHVIVDASSPDVPALVSPAQDEQGVSTSPSLQVTVSDPNGDALDVTFYGRAASSDAGEFTIVALPDTQNYALSYPEIFTDQTVWVASNAAARSIVFLSHEGDVVNDNTEVEWIRANASMSYLDGAVPYGIAPGNHDELDPGTALFNEYFPYTRFEGETWYGGHYGTTNDDSYQLFSAGGVDFIVLHLDFCPGADVIAWADSVLKAYGNRKAIITTHGFIDASGNRAVHQCTSTQYIWDDLVVPNDNVYFILCGHVSGEYARTDIVGGRQVHQLLADYQARESGGNGWLRLLRFSPSEDTVHVETYSPWLGTYEEDANSRFSLHFPMSPPFAVIGTVEDVPSGGSASLVWPNLPPYAQYEWYVEVTDPSGRKAASPIGRFQTGSGDSSPPVISDVEAVDVKAATATVTWTTDEPSDSLVDFGMDEGYGSQAADATLVTAHSVLITGLTAGMTYHYRVTSEDASGNSSSGGDGTLTTNFPPVAEDASVGTVEDSAAAFTLTATDADEDGLTYAIAAGPSHGALSGEAPELTYAPSPDYFGLDFITFVASDGKDESNAATVTITVTEVNDAPVATPQSVAASEDLAVGITLQATDPDGDTLTYTIVAQPPFGTVTGAAPIVTYTPGSNYAGPDSFTFKVNDGTADSNEAAVSITVTSVNDPPVAGPDAYGTGEDATLVVAADSGVLANDVDVEMSPLAAVLVQGPSHGTLDLLPDGSFTYAPDVDFNGSDEFFYAASDGLSQSLSALVSITVSPVNDPPVADGQSIATTEDAPVAVALTASDVDGDPLSYIIVAGPSHGTLIGDAPSVTYAPEADYSGADSFTFKASDGTADGNVATVSITVSPANDAPVAGDQAVVTDEDAPKAIALSATDVDGDALSYSVVAAPSHGTLSGAAPALTYAPDPDWSGPDSFTFQASDGLLASNVATVSITVSAAADPPAVPQGLVATAGDGTVSLDWSDVTDPDGDLAGYKVYRSTTSGTYGDPIATVSSSDHVDGGVANGTTYYYVVKAVDGGGLSSAASSEVSATPTDINYDAYAVSDPVVTYGTLGGDGITGTHAAGDGLVQTIVEAPDGGSTKYWLQAEYSLHTAAPAGEVTSLVLYLTSTWTSLDAKDPLAVSIWNGSAWESITEAIAGGSYAPAAPGNYIDASGNIRVRFADGASLRGEARDTLTIDLLHAHVVAGPPDTTAPAAPVGLTPAPNSSEVLVELYWTANSEPDLAGYKVYRSVTPGSGYKVLTPSPIVGTTYIDPVPGPGTYYYVITAVDSSGNESAASAEASAAVEDLPPSAPTGLAATAGDSQVSLAWSASPEPDVTGYKVYRSTTPGSYEDPIAAVSGSSYVDVGLANGTTYYYVVTAVDSAAMESGYSAEVSAAPAAQASTVHVADISMTIAKVSNKYRATAAVTIADASGAPQQGATVVGDWYFKGSLEQSGATGVTGAGGVASIASPLKPAKSGDVFRFVVTGVSLTGYTYDPAANAETEDSIPVP